MTADDRWQANGMAQQGACGVLGEDWGELREVRDL